MIREAAAHGAKLVCTTECFLDGLRHRRQKHSVGKIPGFGRTIPIGKYFRRLGGLARELQIHLVAGLLEADGEARYNTSILLGPDGKLVGKYRKQKLGHELPLNTPGQSSPVFLTPYGQIGIMICADRTEATIVRRFCTAGADFLLCPSGECLGPRVMIRSCKCVRAKTASGLFLCTRPSSWSPALTGLTCQHFAR
jgi:predicted amidohydrolase